MPSRFEKPEAANDEPGQKRHPAFEEGEHVGEAAQRIVERLKVGKLPAEEEEEKKVKRQPPEDLEDK